MVLSIKITFSKTTNQDSNQVTLVYITLLQLHITFSVLFMLTLHWKFVAFSLIYLKHSIEFGMMVCLINSRVMELTVTSLNLFNRFQTSCFFYSWFAARFSSRPIRFLIFINDLPLGLTTIVKLFADDISLSSVVNNAIVSASRLNNDLVKIQDCAFNSKISFNPDPNKPAKDVIFSRKMILVLTLRYFSTIH